MAFKKQLVTSCKQAIWGEILGGNAPNYAFISQHIKKLLFTQSCNPRINISKMPNQSRFFLF